MSILRSLMLASFSFFIIYSCPGKQSKANKAQCSRAGLEWSVAHNIEINKCEELNWTPTIAQEFVFTVEFLVYCWNEGRIPIYFLAGASDEKIKFIFRSVFISTFKFVSLTAKGWINKFCNLSGRGIFSENRADNNFPPITILEHFWKQNFPTFFTSQKCPGRVIHGRRPEVVNVIAGKKKFSVSFLWERAENLMDQKSKLFKHTPIIVFLPQPVNVILCTNPIAFLSTVNRDWKK